jgi:threonine aldolase
MQAKARYQAAQLLAYIQDGNWLTHAECANQCARMFADGISAHDGVEVLNSVEINLVFFRLSQRVQTALAKRNLRFKVAPGFLAEARVFRVATSFATWKQHIEFLLKAVDDAISAAVPD